jgi:4-amino-4-deoxy-L-arabinose transferase-like glycosyltransferase
MVAARLAWVWLVRWRTGRHREALWKSLVLPAGGVALCWLLLMTLWLPLLDYARSNRALVDRTRRHVPRLPGCIAAPGNSPCR